jgi:hypothetical protein
MTDDRGWLEFGHVPVSCVPFGRYRPSIDLTKLLLFHARSPAYWLCCRDAHGIRPSNQASSGPRTAHAASFLYFAL